MPETNPFAEVDLTDVHAKVPSGRAENGQSASAGQSVGSHNAASSKGAEGPSFEPLEIVTEDPTGNCAFKYSLCWMNLTRLHARTPLDMAGVNSAGSVYSYCTPRMLTPTIPL
jgi:hypothetical protein